MIAPSLQTEGKALQVSQGVGMGARGAVRTEAPPQPRGENGSDREPALSEG